MHSPKRFGSYATALLTVAALLVSHSPSLAAPANPAAPRPAIAPLTGVKPPTTFKPGDTRIQAHRGGPDLGAAENSMKLFKLAAASGVVDTIETDVRMTKDKVLVLHHDQDLSITCTSAGIPVSSFTWAELSEVRCNGEPIPKLTELLTWAKKTRIGLNLELKLDKTANTTLRKEFVKRVIETVKAAKMPKTQLSLASYYWRTFGPTFKKLGKGITMTAMEFPARTEPLSAPFAAVREAKSYGMAGFSLSLNHASEGLLAFTRDYARFTRLGLGDRKGTSDERFALAQGVRTFTSDDPVAKRAQLDRLLTDIHKTPLARVLTTTTLPATQLANKNLKPKQKVFVKVLGGKDLVPVSAAKQLHGLQFEVTITGKGKGTVEFAPSGSRVGVDGKRVKIPKGTKTFKVLASPGDKGQVRIRASQATKVQVSLVSYLTANY